MRILGFEISYRARPKAPAHGVETRSVGECASGPLWTAVPGTSSSGPVTVKAALSIPAVWSAVDTVSKTLASLPFDLFEKTDDGSRAATNHPLYNLTKLEPGGVDGLLSGFDFRRALFAQACFGDAVAVITERNGIGRPSKIELLRLGEWELFQRDNGNHYYVVRRMIGSRYSQEIYRPSDVIHVKGLTLDGMQGLSTTEVHKSTWGAQIASQAYADSFFGNSAQVSGAIVYPNPLNAQQVEAARKNISSNYTGLPNVGKTMVLDGGVKYERFGLDPEQAGLINFRKHGVEENARIFGVPVHLLHHMDRMTFNNVEMLSVQFVTLCIRPWAVQFEQEMARKTLSAAEKATASHFYRLNLDGLLRGDTETRAKYFTAGIQNGWLTPNDVRRLENMNTMEGGDRAFIQQNMMPIDSIDEILMKEDEPQTVAESQTDEPQNENENEPSAAQ